MKTLNLRNRLLVAIGLLAVVQIAVGIIIISETRAELLGQIDDRLEAAVEYHDQPNIERAEVEQVEVEPDSDDREADGRRGDDRDDRDRSRRDEPRSDTFEGRLDADGELITYFASTSFRRDFSPPEVNAAELRRARNKPFTVDETRGDAQYRIIGTEASDGGFVVTALPLDGVSSTMDRVTTLVAISIAGLSLILGAVAWWVLRLGIAPIKRMTTSAQAIAEGDLSERITDANPNTEAGQLGQALNTMLGRIETSIEERIAAEQRLRQFIADASHELRTPVSTIRGYAELYGAGGLSERGALDDAMRRTGQESERMSRLINDMLSLAKLDRQPELSIGPVDICALAQNVTDDMRAANPERTITLDLPDTAEVVAGDPDLLLQAFTNLVGNALVHTDDAVHITVSNATFTIADHGDGMTPDVAKRITERFYRADKSRARNSGGSGLGLSIVQSIVDSHGGELDIDTAPGDGTTISITLPRV